jgi:hypothetical protein
VLNSKKKRFVKNDSKFSSSFRLAPADHEHMIQAIDAALIRGVKLFQINDIESFYRLITPIIVQTWKDIRGTIFYERKNIWSDKKNYASIFVPFIVILFRKTSFSEKVIGKKRF